MFGLLQRSHEQHQGRISQWDKKQYVICESLRSYREWCFKTLCNKVTEKYKTMNVQI